MPRKNKNANKGNRTYASDRSTMQEGVKQEYYDKGEKNVSKEEKEDETYRKGRGKSNRQTIKPGKFGNSPDWYALSPQLLNDAASISFNNPLGTGIEGIVSENSDYFLPGVLELRYASGIGYSADNSSAVNLAARRLYTYVRHANSGSANYDSPDLMLYCLAITSVYEMYTQCVRAYGIANVYSQMNRYLPDALLTAAGFDPEDVRKNLADFRYGINVAAAKINSLAIPASFTFYKRKTWLCQNVYRDSNEIKGQMYVLRPSGYYTYEEKSTATGGKLKYSNLSQVTYKVADWLGVLNSMIAKLVESEDIGIMAGDILKAFGADSLVKVPPIAETFITVPVFDAEVLMQIENAVIADISTDVEGSGNGAISSLDIEQDINTGAIKYMPVLTNNSPQAGTRDALKNFTRTRLLNIRSDSPTPADVMVASRLVAIGTWSSTGTPVTLTTIGTEVISRARIWKYTINPTTKVWTLSSSGIYGVITWSVPSSGSLTLTQAQLETIADYTKFDYAPLIYNGKISSTDCFAIFGDLDNSTPISKQTLNKMHTVALLSMFDVPALNAAWGTTRK